MKETTYNKYKRENRELNEKLHRMQIMFKNYINANNFGTTQQTFDNIEKWFEKNTHYRRNENGKLV